MMIAVAIALFTSAICKFVLRVVGVFGYIWYDQLVSSAGKFEANLTTDNVGLQVLLASQQAFHEPGFETQTSFGPPLVR
jgi:hypothetical protein